MAFAAATTGPANLFASVLTRDLTVLYRYLTTAVAAVPGVEQVETAPVLRQVKAAITNHPRRRAHAASSSRRA